MSDVSDQAPDRFTVTYSEEELWALGKLAQRRLDHGPAVDAFWSVIIGVMLAVGLVPFAALALGLIGSSAFRPVLATAYLAFTAGGLAFWAVMAMRNRGIARANYRQGRGSEALEYVFDDTGVVLRGDMLETRMPWRAVKGVEDASTFVIIWLRDHQAVGLPARLFANTAARDTFIASVAARIMTAKPAP
jgi:hypothetical protein